MIARETHSRKKGYAMARLVYLPCEKAAQKKKNNSGRQRAIFSVDSDDTSDSTIARVFRAGSLTLTLPGTKQKN